ncbi:uncharacterized protein [Ptychodera flava]|uniref:uncharacterized protein n=1 Tax=Ptychodera flava TaxID=63121 RepID=UPI00396A4878
MASSTEEMSCEKKTLQLSADGDIPLVKTKGQRDAKSGNHSLKGESGSDFADLNSTGLISGELVHEGEKKTLELSTAGDIPLVKTKGQHDAKSGSHSVKGESDSDWTVGIFVFVGISLLVQVGIISILLMIRKRRKKSRTQRTEVEMSTRADET